MARKRKRKRASAEKIILRILLATAAVALAVSYIIDVATRPPNVFYPGFEIEIPPGYAIHGIDVSRYQDVINWQSVSAMEARDLKIGFAFIKATEGTNRIDPQFRRNWLKAEENQITKGAYHFFIPTKSGKKQAANFTQIVNLQPGDLPPVLDIEKTFGAKAEIIKKESRIWLDEVERFYKVKPIIYTNIDFYTHYLQDDFSDYPLWIAHYLQAEKPRLDHPWVFWQHSETGRVNGILSPVDFNVFIGDSVSFRSLLIKRN